MSMDSVQSCDSSPKVIISVTEFGHRVSNVHLELYREIENGERLVWSGVTDWNGAARPDPLAVGKYRVFAKEKSIVMLLTVSSEEQERTQWCEMKAHPQGGEKTPSLLTAPAASIRLRKFRGVVQDENEAVIAKLKIQVLRRDSLDKGSVAEAVSDDRGQFSVPLANGAYVAVFGHSGFRNRVVAFELARKGWQGFRLTMIVAGGSGDGPLPVEWNDRPGKK